MTDLSATRNPWRIGLALAGVSVVALTAAVYGSRNAIAQYYLVGWLHDRGVDASAEVQSIGPGGFTGSVRAGPDFAAERVELAYSLTGFWNGKPLGVEVTRVRLVKPVVRATVHNGLLSVGKLDPIIAEFRKRPPRPDAAKPRVEIVGGLLLLATDYGLVQARADALVNDDKLMSLNAVTAPARLLAQNLNLALGAGRLTLTTKGDRTHVTVDAPVSQGAVGGLRAQGARLNLVVDAPYPDLVKRRGDGAVIAHATLTGKRLAFAGEAFDDARVSAGFQGQAAGWIPDLIVRGQGVADVRVGAATVGAARAGALKAAVSASDIVWSRRGGDAVSANLALVGGVDELSAADLRMRQLSVAMKGPVGFGPKGASAGLEGSVLGRGGWSGMGPPLRTDAPQLAAIKRAARSFRIAAPDVGLQGTDGDFRLRLPRPVVFSADSGGQARLSQPAFGVYRLAVAGGGLPKVEAEARQIGMISGGLFAEGRIQAASLSFGPVVAGSVDAAGALRLKDGALSFAASRCATLGAERLELGVNDLGRLKGELCPAGAPVLTFAAGAWKLAGRIEHATAEVAFLQARVSDGAGALEAGGRGASLRMTARGLTGRLADTAPSTRFYPLRIAGEAGLNASVWRGDLAVSDPAGRALANVGLRHDGRSGQGGVDIDTGTLGFAEGGLQPAALSPLAAAVGSPAVGSARFTGRFGWSAGGAQSNGVLDVPRLDFVSPAGKVTGLSGHVVFTSLAPLIAAPGQELTAESVAAIAPITGLKATFGLGANGLEISTGEAAVGGGHIRLEALTIPLAAGATAQGTVQFDGVQLHDLVEASPFGDRVDLDARVSGRAPFEVVAPATPAVAPVPGADTFTDFAYQAMENLAFDKMDATVDSLPEGRLGILFHIVGRHDPPQHQEIRLSLMDLIKRRFLDRKLPLPSGTGVDLTLDTTVNLDDLLRDYANYQQLRSSRGVQP